MVGRGSGMGSKFPVKSRPNCALWNLPRARKPPQKIEFIIWPYLQSSLPHTFFLSFHFSFLPFLSSIFGSLDSPKPPTEDRFILPDEFAESAMEEPVRSKRSPINSNRVGGLNVETLVVADRKMLEKHGRENVTTYVLTVMNMVREGKERWS